jgi:hypothetical protein
MLLLLLLLILKKTRIINIPLVRMNWWVPVPLQSVHDCQRPIQIGDVVEVRSRTAVRNFGLERVVERRASKRQTEIKMGGEEPARKISRWMSMVGIV